MATIEQTSLQFAAQWLNDVVVTLTYTVTFDEFDQNRNLPYTEPIRLFGQGGLSTRDRALYAPCRLV